MSVHGEGSGASSLVIYADSVLRYGISSQSLTSKKSNSELVQSLRALLDSALSIKDDQDFIWEPQKCRISIPNPQSLDHASLDQPRASLDVTAKLFYLLETPDQPYPSWIAESLHHLTVATGLDSVDTLILSFPHLTFDDDQANPSQNYCDDLDSRDSAPIRTPEEDRKVMQRIESVWAAASNNHNIKTLGLSEFSKTRLSHLLHSIDGDDSKKLRQPRINQVNLRENTGSIPAELINFTGIQGIELITHADCSDLLPPESFQSLLDLSVDRLPPPLRLSSTKIRPFVARWVLKYTVLQRDRGVIVDKGYVICSRILH